MPVFMKSYEAAADVASGIGSESRNPTFRLGAYFEPWLFPWPRLATRLR